MPGRILFLTGAAVGYVLGSRAGRRRYEQIKAGAERLWNDPKVQSSVDKAVGQVQSFVKEKTPQVQAAVADRAKKAVSQVTKRGSGGDSATPAA